MSVSGRATTNEVRQSKSLDNRARLTRVATSGAARFHAALHVHRELPAQEQVLGGDDPRGLQCHDGEPQHVREQLTGSVEQRNHAPIMP
jgi:hypothetical protein